MRQIVTALFLLLLLVLTFLSPPSAGAISIKDLDYDVLNSYDIDNVEECYYNKQNKTVNHRTVKTCVYENQQVTVGTYYDNRAVGRVAASFTPGGELYPIKINSDWFNCQYNRCIYLSDSDVMLNFENTNNSYIHSLVIYKNFTKNLHIQSDYSGKYFNYNNPERQVLRATPDSPGFAVGFSSVGVSSNGKWVVAELMGVGIVRFNFKEGTHTRVYPDVLEHRTAPVSSSEFAIDDSGRNVFHTGINVGLKRYVVTDNCGDNRLDSSPVSNQCQRYEIKPEKIIWSMNHGTSPAITSNGVMQFFAKSTDPYLKYKFVQIGDRGSSNSTLNMLSLGDSFTSGEGEVDDKRYVEGTNTPYEKCHLSDRSYPYLVARDLNYATQKTRSVACSGAVTEDIVGHSAYIGQRDRLKHLISPTVLLSDLQDQAKRDFIPGRIEQSHFVGTSKADVVTVGIGGNDSGLMSKLNQCGLPDTCKWADDAVYKNAVKKEIAGLFDRLVKTYKKLKQASPASKVYAISYPQIISPAGDCPELVGLMFNQKERIFINESLSYMNQIINKSSEAAGVNYIDIENSFSDNLLCEKTNTPAMNTVRGGDDVDILGIQKIIGNESFHPTPHGHRLMADAIKSQISTQDFSVQGQLLDPIELEPLSDYWSGANGRDLTIRHTDLASLDKDRTKDITSLFEASSEIVFTAKRLGDDEPEHIVSTKLVQPYNIVQPIFDTDSWGQGIYSLTVTGQSKNSTLLELYSSYVKKGSEGGAVQTNETVDQKETEDRQEGAGHNQSEQNKGQPVNNNTTEMPTVPLVGSPASTQRLLAQYDKKPTPQSGNVSPQNNLLQSSPPMQNKLHVQDNLSLKNKPSIQEKAHKNTERIAKKDDTTDFYLPAKYLQLIKFAGLTTLLLGFAYILIYKIRA